MRFITCRNPFSRPIYLLANYMEQSLSYSIKQYLRHVVDNVCLSSLSHGKRCKYTIYYVISVAVARVFSKSANSLFWGSDNCFFKHSIQEKYYKKMLSTSKLFYLYSLVFLGIEFKFPQNLSRWPHQLACTNITFLICHSFCVSGIAFLDLGI